MIVLYFVQRAEQGLIVQIIRKTMKEHHLRNKVRTAKITLINPIASRIILKY